MFEPRDTSWRAIKIFWTSRNTVDHELSRSNKDTKYILCRALAVNRVKTSSCALLLFLMARGKEPLEALTGETISRIQKKDWRAEKKTRDRITARHYARTCFSVKRGMTGTLETWLDSYFLFLEAQRKNKKQELTRASKNKKYVQHLSLTSYHKRAKKRQFMRAIISGRKKERAAAHELLFAETRKRKKKYEPRLRLLLLINGGYLFLLEPPRDDCRLTCYDT